MKPTTHHSKCATGTRRASASAACAHTPARHRTGAARCRSYSAPSGPGMDHPAYVERVGTARDWQPAASDSRQPRVLHVDTETGTATVLACLLGSDIHVTHVATLGQAQQLLQRQIFSLVVLDPALPDGDARSLLPLLNGTPLLVYSDKQPEWRDTMPAPFLSKSWTTARQLWTRMTSMLCNTNAISAGD